MWESGGRMCLTDHTGLAFHFFNENGEETGRKEGGLQPKIGQPH